MEYLCRRPVTSCNSRSSRRLAKKMQPLEGNRLITDHYFLIYTNFVHIKQSKTNAWVEKQPTQGAKRIKLREKHIKKYVFESSLDTRCINDPVLYLPVVVLS